MPSIIVIKRTKKDEKLRIGSSGNLQALGRITLDSYRKCSGDQS
jgi:hypothetical protein